MPSIQAKEAIPPAIDQIEDVALMPNGIVAIRIAVITEIDDKRNKGKKDEEKREDIYLPDFHKEIIFCEEVFDFSDDHSRFSPQLPDDFSRFGNASYRSF